MLVASNGWWVGSIIFLIIWIAIAFWPARVAARKGHSFILYFLFSLVFFPAALIVAYLVGDHPVDRPGRAYPPAATYAAAPSAARAAWAAASRASGTR